jgi:hypothetical protein
MRLHSNERMSKQLHNASTERIQDTVATLRFHPPNGRRDRMNIAAVIELARRIVRAAPLVVIAMPLGALAQTVITQPRIGYCAEVPSWSTSPRRPFAACAISDPEERLRAARRERFRALREDAGREGEFKPAADDPWQALRAQQPSRRPEPTASREIQDGYRDTSVVRPEYGASGQALPRP